MSNPEAIETKVTIENPDIGEEADDVMEMKAISGSGLAQPPTIKVKLMTCFYEFSKYTQYPIIRNGLIRDSAEFLGKFKKRALGRSN